MASLKPFDESRKITVFCEKTCQALFFYFLKKITLSSYRYFLINFYVHGLTGRNWPLWIAIHAAPMYSTQLCIVHSWLQSAKPYFIGLQKNWKPISLT